MTSSTPTDSGRDPGAALPDLRLAYGHIRIVTKLKAAGRTETLTLGVGVTHAVPAGLDTALCGAGVVWPRRDRRPSWHSPTPRTCLTCARLFTTEQQSNGEQAR
jgi:hypothetical protein